PHPHSQPHANFDVYWNFHIHRLVNTQFNTFSNAYGHQQFHLDSHADGDLLADKYPFAYSHGHTTALLHIHTNRKPNSGGQPRLHTGHGSNPL
ncbi:MAG TPA: hypothetical protein VJ873_04065, partial [bacterium]|nr:hypothetical protein [bacterium]